MIHPNLVELALRFRDKSNEIEQFLPNVQIFERRTVSNVEATVYTPVICLILQDAKETKIGDQSVQLTAGDALLVSHDLPVTSTITRASLAAPYLALILSLDVALMRSLYDHLAGRLRDTGETRALSADPADPAWVTPLMRYLSLMNDPLDAQVLGPQILKEIHYRLMRAPIGGMLRNLLAADSPASRIARAISKIRAEFRTSVTISELARAAGMSASSFHEHFKFVTGTTPLQYLKDLRLIEARSLLQSGGQSVSAAGFSVGYESPTHFSRDYARKFGTAPSRDSRAVTPA